MSTIIVMLEILYGSTRIGLNDVQEELTLPIGHFLSEPSIKVGTISYSGIFERKEIEVEFDATNYIIFARGVTSGRAFPEVYVRIWQWEVKDGSDTLNELFNGQLSKATLNPAGRQNVLRLNCITEKSKTRRASGINGTETCDWTFGDPKTCTKDLGPLTEVGTITTFTRNIVTITGLPAKPDFYWNKGRIVADGIDIRIKEWISGTTFILSKLLPKEWEDTITGFGSKAVDVIPGCNKLYSDCQRYANTPNFQGPGIAILDYNPFFENGG